MTVLVIDDDLAIRDFLAEMLGDEGYTVVSMAHGASALAYLETCEVLPQLILLDLTMPIMSGWEFREHQLRDPRLAGIPVVVVSADGNLRQKAREIGVDDYLQKPILITTLLGTVARYVPAKTSP